MRAAAADEPPIYEFHARADSGAFTANHLAGREIPPRIWNVPGMIPAGTATTLDGDGGTGKSTLALQLAVATVLGKTWLNRGVLQGRALYLSAEDDVDELHRRLADMCVHFDAGLEDLGDLKLWPLEDESELVVSDPRGSSTTPTPLWATFEAMAREWRPALIVLDSRADVYGADEISRRQVRAFVGMLRTLARGLGAGLLLLSHPSLTGISSGSGSSGSTAWSNSVRSRLYLSKPPAGDDTHDPDLRLLSLKKANYAPESADLRVYRRAGVFVTENKPNATSLDRSVERNRIDRLFLEILAAYADRGQRVSPSTGANYAPALFARDARAAGVNKAGFAASMNRLLDAGTVKILTVGSPSKQRQELTISSRADAC